MTDQYAGEEVGFQKWIFGFDLKEEREDMEDKLLHIYTQKEKKTKDDRSSTDMGKCYQ